MKSLDKIKITPELKEYYRIIGLFLKAHPEIESKKLVLGYQVKINTIPKHLINEWIEITKQ